MSPQNRVGRACACMGAALFFAFTQHVPAQRPVTPHLDRTQLAKDNFGADAAWYERNIPFLEIDDPGIQQIYYYRWKLYRSHIRQIGPQGTTVLEFLDNVPWARQPYTDLNDSASFHLLEGRWLRDPAVVDDLIDHLYTGGANDRHFSESLAAASLAATTIAGDPQPALRHLDTMEHIYNLWDDHFDRQRNLYWIEPLLDATEYTISSIDASGAGFTDHPSTDPNRNGFTGGYAFRPSINSYQYANALAIAQLARLAGKPEVSADYTARAARLRDAVLHELWNPALAHFTDIYQRSTPFVHAGDFIRGRELVGYVPWMYGLVPDDATYNSAWQHLLKPDELAGPHGLRTAEPTYARYMEQYRYDAPTGKPECQWNGPSWPFQTSQALTAMANLLHTSAAPPVTRDDYVRLLRQYTAQHFLSPGHPDLQEDDNPDTGAPIVGLARSHHYAHSTYIDLVLSGLLGIEPSLHALRVDPLLPSGSERPIRYFLLDNLAYHGHEVTIVYDRDGSRYHAGRGLAVFVDHHRAAHAEQLRALDVPIASRVPKASPRRVDIAANPGLPDGPTATASSGEPAEAIDGRMWFFPEHPNGWSPTVVGKSWIAVDFRQPQTLSSVELDFTDAPGFAAPSKYVLEYRQGDGWRAIPGATQPLIAGGANVLHFAAIRATAVRVRFSPPGDAAQNFRLIELEAFR